jgi:hypothetical protein
MFKPKRFGLKGLKTESFRGKRSKNRKRKNRYGSIGQI